MHMAKTAKIIMGPQPNAMHNPRPKTGAQMFHLCSILLMNITIGLLPDSQCLAANERDMGMQSSLKCTIMYTHLKPHETLVRCGPYLSNVLTSALIPGKTGYGGVFALRAPCAHHARYFYDDFPRLSPQVYHCRMKPSS